MRIDRKLADLNVKLDMIGEDPISCTDFQTEVEQHQLNVRDDPEQTSSSIANDQENQERRVSPFLCGVYILLTILTITVRAEFIFKLTFSFCQIRLEKFTRMQADFLSTTTPRTDDDMLDINDLTEEEQMALLMNGPLANGVDLEESNEQIDVAAANVILISLYTLIHKTCRDKETAGKYRSNHLRILY